ncbi:MAG TPA: hypothetical protein VGF60_14120 [Xanthobacteraceae bacterium]|jgi:hypothetical protein
MTALGRVAQAFKDDGRHLVLAALIFGTMVLISAIFRLAKLLGR